MIRISPEHPESDDPRLLALCRALERRGAAVVIDELGENMVRVEPVEGVATAVVHSEGLANLLHEYVHVVCAGVLEDDHGIDYGKIPFDMESEEGRTILFAELAACVVSCGMSRRDPDPWFVEQVEIQPVFYGHETSPAGFWTAIDGVVERHGAELESLVDRLYAGLESELLANGAGPADARPVRRIGFGELWGRYRAGASW